MYRRLSNLFQRRELFLGLSLWASLYLTAKYINISRNREIYLLNPIVYNSEEDFLQDLKQEKSKLGLDNIKISCENDKNIEGGHCFREGKEKYLIKFNPSHKSKKVLRHELYHIKKYESFSLDDLLDGLFFGGYEEWRATNYSLQE